MSNLDEQLLPHRQAIDEIDNQILHLLNQRAHHAHTIGELKGESAVYRPEREAQVLRDKILKNQAIKGILPNQAIARLFREIMSECLAIERPLTIAHLGPAGTFTEQAVIKHFGHATQTIACNTVEESFRLVEVAQADYVVAPIENSTEGSVGVVLDLLIRNKDLIACGEIVLRIHHHLLRKKMGLDGVKVVYAHSQAIGQCQKWLARVLPHVPCVAVASNAEGAKLAQADESAVAIASTRASEIYHLHKIFENIEDEPHNTTRFLVLGKQHTSPSGQDKTSLILSAPNQAGAMTRLIKPIAEAGISMTKLESRPSRTDLWEYVFFIDIEGHVQDEKVARVLHELDQVSTLKKIIGSYPVAVY